LMWRRTASRRSAVIDGEMDVEVLASHHASPAETMDEREIIHQLYAAIHGLSDGDRALILLSLDGLTYREIAEITGNSENQVGVGLNRARQRLAEKMRRTHL